MINDSVRSLSWTSGKFHKWAFHYWTVVGRLVGRVGLWISKQITFNFIKYCFIIISTAFSECIHIGNKRGRDEEESISKLLSARGNRRSFIEQKSSDSIACFHCMGLVCCGWRNQITQSITKGLIISSFSCLSYSLGSMNNKQTLLNGKCRWCWTASTFTIRLRAEHFK